MNATETERTAATTPGPDASAAATAAPAPAAAAARRVRLEADVDTIEVSQLPKPKTITVLGVLVGASLVLSYLGSYAFTNAMLTAELIKPWAEGSDPRPRWLLISFCGLMTMFLVVAGTFRFLSRRQLRSIDATADATDEYRITDT